MDIRLSNILKVTYLKSPTSMTSSALNTESPTIEFFYDVHWECHFFAFDQNWFLINLFFLRHHLRSFGISSPVPKKQRPCKGAALHGRSFLSSSQIYDIGLFRHKTSKKNKNSHHSFVFRFFCSASRFLAAQQFLGSLPGTSNRFFTPSNSKHLLAQASATQRSP